MFRRVVWYIQLVSRNIMHSIFRVEVLFSTENVPSNSGTLYQTTRRRIPENSNAEYS
jgi:hypothetical protein